MKILLLEDDGEIGAWVSGGLVRSGHVVDWLKSGRDALVAATTHDYDVLVLDRMVPELDGLSVLKALRAAKIGTPALILTALGDVDDRVEGLRSGADDYLRKPFAFSELEARIEVLVRRQGTLQPQPQPCERCLQIMRGIAGKLSHLAHEDFQLRGGVIHPVSKLVQMLANLIENSIRHTPEGTVLTLIASARELGLSDTGPGIPPEEYDNVTRPMYRLDKSRGSESAGLGLALVKTIAEIHGAELVLSENAATGAPGLFVRAVFPE